MYRLSSLILLLFGCFQTFAQSSPHGVDFNVDCIKCHTSESWKINYKTITFNHNTTGFVLEGMHNQTDCIQCHQTLVFKDTPNQCMSCHTDMHSGSVGNDCARCHSPKSWIVNNIPELHLENGFALTGAHSNLTCIHCHKSETKLRFDRIGNDCISCHQTTFNNTKNPNHLDAGFSTDCITCHSPLTNDWNAATFDHSKFPLTLGHDIQECSACHKPATKYADTPTDCISCHQNTFNTTTNPNHLEAGFSTDCKTCHTTNPNWTPVNWNHDFFPLTQGHNLPDCKQCHTTANYSDTKSDCVSCHQTDFNNTKNPNHVDAGFPTDCVTCHTTNPGWTPATFDHSSFPLTLGHDLPDCKQCHTTANYADASPDCVSCHQNNFDKTTNPNHKAVGFSTDCITCHTPAGWTPSTFDHNAFFPLTLGHDIQDCKQCHTTASYADASTDCISCHQTTFYNTTNPNHVTSGFPTDCATCHTTNPGWTPVTFDHNTVYPLVGAHATIANDCVSCHKGNYTNTPNTCVGCHQTDYNNTTNPNHLSSQFSTDCKSCHTQTSWVPSTFNHSFFPLTLGHATPSCTQCHTSTNYAATSPDCVSCHQTAYNNTTNPNHASSGFPTDCAACHTTNPGWTPSTFDHAQYFPIASGRHSGFNCNECHTTPNTLSTFSCIACHTHSNKSSVDNEHRKVSGYVYNGTSCYDCHRNGKAD